MKTIDVIVNGMGHVGIALLKLLERGDRFERQGFAVRVVAAIDSKGGIFNSTGLTVRELIDTKQRQKTIAVEPELTAQDCLASCETLPVLLESTPVDIEPGGIGYTAIRAFLEHGADVITANKGPLVFAFQELNTLAFTQGAYFGFSGTLGFPLMCLSRNLSHARIERLEAILNGTTNSILTAMHQGIGFDDALAHMKAAGLTESDPSMDISGADAAHKLVILSNTLLGMPASRSDVATEGIAGITSADIERAANRGEVIKLLATANVGTDGSYTLRVAPTSIPMTHPLANLNSTTIGLRLHTDIAGEIAVSLTQSEPTPTASAMLADLIQSVAMRAKRV